MHYSGFPRSGTGCALPSGRLVAVATGLLLAAGLLACAGSSPTESADGAPPSLSFSNNPENGNLRIVRFDDAAFWLLIDDAAGLFSIQSTSNGQLGCQRPRTFLKLAEWQFVVHDLEEPEAARVNALLFGRDIYVAVYQGPFSAWEAEDFDCAALFARKLAEGTGDVTFTDNNFFAAQQLEAGAERVQDAFGFTARARLDRIAGGTARYTGVSRCEASTAHGERCVGKINFH
jgi:hypothetical protein